MTNRLPVRIGAHVMSAVLATACTALDGGGRTVSPEPFVPTTDVTVAPSVAPTTAARSLPESDGVRRDPLPTRTCLRPADGSEPLTRRARALLVSGSDAPAPGDVPVQRRLEQLGIDVTVVDDDRVTADLAGGFDVVLVSESTSSATIGAMFAAIAVPVITWERRLYEPLGLSNVHNWHTEPQDSVFVTDRLDACGTFGAVQVATSAALPMNRALPPASADVVAVRADGSDEAVWFLYRTGDVLANGAVAPAARMALWFSEEMPLHTTEAGWQLFDRAVDLVRRPPGDSDATSTTSAVPTSEPESAAVDASPVTSMPVPTIPLRTSLRIRPAHGRRGRTDRNPAS